MDLDEDKNGEQIDAILEEHKIDCDGNELGFLDTRLQIEVGEQVDAILKERKQIKQHKEEKDLIETDEANIGTRSRKLNDSTNGDTKIFDPHKVHTTMTVRIAEIANADYVIDAINSQVEHTTEMEHTAMEFGNLSFLK